MPRLHLLLAVLLLSPAVIAALPAAAQDDLPTRSAAARALFDEGIAEADQGRWEAAAGHFRRALALRGSAVIRLNLAVALEHTGQVVESTELLRMVIRDPSASEEARETAATTLGTVEPRIAWIRLVLRGRDEAVEVRIDGRPVTPELASTRIPVDPGAHEVRALVAGEEVAAASVRLDDGASENVVLVLREAERGSAALDAPVSAHLEPAPSLRSDATPVAAMLETPSGPDPLAVGLGTAGGIVLVAGIVTVILVVALPNQGAAVPGDLGVIEVGR